MTDEHKLMARATGIVANLLEGPNCVEGAALLLEVGQRLDYALEPQPVSLFATSNDGHVATGTTGRAFGENYLARRGGVQVAREFDGGTPFQREAGHMILVSREHHLLMDPTFSQFKKLGPAAIAIFVEDVDSIGKQREYWTVEDESFYVRYFAAPGYMPD